MASVCGRVSNRTMKSAVRNFLLHRNTKPPSAFPSSAAPAPLRSRRFSFSRLPVELGSAESLMPLHSAVAAARLTACLSTTSRSCRSLSQELGLSVPR